ncbi:hypothetical protein [Rhizobium leguminosarum]|uniref:hypothetical protein n=1 Tax=Rhizobium leguminosarum TaxID=384 RepID=UPI001C973A78|nr:hypothetical protein [Rhizobium leguminosarum]
MFFSAMFAPPNGLQYHHNSQRKRLRKRFDGHISISSISLEDEIDRVTAELGGLSAGGNISTFCSGGDAAAV